MSLFTHVVVFGAGYALGRPGGRAQARNLLARGRELAGRPEVKRVRDRGPDLAGDRVAAAKRRLDPRSRPADLDALSHGTLPPGPAPTGS